MNAYTHAQIRAINSEVPRTLVVAVPGSGKTHTLIGRIERLWRAGVDPQRIVCITFTTGAARELASRLPAGLVLGYCGTLHGWALRSLQRHGHLIGLPSRLSVIDQERADETLRRIITESRYTGTLAAVQQSVAGLMRGQKSQRSPAPCELVARRYLQTLRSSGLLSFDLILSEFLRLVRANVVFNDLEWPFPNHLLVDEFQDSGDLDAAIYDELPVANKFIVGDWWQSIFGFRGSNPEHIRELANNPGWRTIELDLNFRSVQPICDAANRLSGRSMQAYNGSSPDYPAAHGFDDAAAEAMGLYHELADGCGSAAVLVRYNAEAERLRQLLESMGIPIARAVRSDRPKDWPLAKAALALLADPTNHWVAFWYLRERIGPAAEAMHLQAIASDVSLAALARQGGLDIPASVETPQIGQASARLGASPESVALIEQAVADNPGAGAAELLLALAEEPEAQQTDGVYVGTLHSAKGREWDRVFMPSMEEGTLPRNDQTVEEDRRLCYVGITRARHQLWLGWARQRPDPYTGQTVMGRPSRFLKEMGL